MPAGSATSPSRITRSATCSLRRETSWTPSQPPRLRSPLPKRLAKADPANAGWQRDLSVSQEKLGDVLVQQGNLAEALAGFKAALAIRKRLANADPANAGWQRDLSVSHERVGTVLAAQGNLADALAAFEDALAIAERLANADPPMPAGKPIWPAPATPGRCRSPRSSTTRRWKAPEGSCHHGSAGGDVSGPCALEAISRDFRQGHSRAWRQIEREVDRSSRHPPPLLDCARRPSVA